MMSHSVAVFYEFPAERSQLMSDAKLLLSVPINGRVLWSSHSPLPYHSPQTQEEEAQVVVMQADDTHILVVATVDNGQPPEQVHYREQFELGRSLAQG